MIRINRRESLGILLAAAAGSSVSFSDDSLSKGVSKTAWASYRNGPLQQGKATCTLPVEPELKWEFPSKDGWKATCAVVDDEVFAPALEGFLYCLDRETGAVRWKYRTIENPDPKKFAPGFKAAPLVTKDAVYVGDEDGTLHAVNRKTGKSLGWTFPTGAEIAGGVTPFKDRLLLASHDAFLYCLDTSGKEVWKFETQDRINCSPAVVEDLTFVSGCDAHLRIIDLKPDSEKREKQDIDMGSYLIASPAINGDVLFVGDHSGTMSAINWRTGEVVWRYQGDRLMPFHSSAALSDGLVLFGGDDKLLHAVDQKTGKGRWTYRTRASIECSAAAVEDRVYFGGGDGNLYGLSVEDGEEVWKFNAGKAFTAGLAIGENHLIAGEDASNGRLLCFG